MEPEAQEQRLRASGNRLQPLVEQVVVLILIVIEWVVVELLVHLMVMEVLVVIHPGPILPEVAVELAVERVVRLRAAKAPPAVVVVREIPAVMALRQIQLLSEGLVAVELLVVDREGRPIQEKSVRQAVGLVGVTLHGLVPHLLTL